MPTRFPFGHAALTLPAISPGSSCPLLPLEFGWPTNLCRAARVMAPGDPGNIFAGREEGGVGGEGRCTDHFERQSHDQLKGASVSGRLALNGGGAAVE